MLKFLLVMAGGIRMVVDKKVFANMLVQAAEYMQAKTEYLSEMDSCFGDGDHGITIGKIAALI